MVRNYLPKYPERKRTKALKKFIKEHQKQEVIKEIYDQIIECCTYMLDDIMISQAEVIGDKTYRYEGSNRKYFYECKKPYKNLIRAIDTFIAKNKGTPVLTTVYDEVWNLVIDTYQNDV